ncbi:ScbA/BarX family gamma-butyrolactone biosynthesis protein [Streptomyces beijiangensis]|uniref:A-factor biosynthesis hotdog domain-containing protein n=2 Tax=Streptomyces beijiangensis TaxID=163361 RepID=A0A939FCP9_9ACTN|nr:ScbA/BarX family gamma-butyrolactone biosynthesis protein [Streptomyces beijiangensis]MBO0516202.1 hypothetical protein [Streptomyces beijiangensis]
MGGTLIPAGTIGYETTVPRALVHRTAVSEVFLTGWRRTGGDSFLCAAQWPRGHSLYGAEDGTFDPLIIVESTRQAGILLAHVGYEVPLGHSFLMQRLSWRSTAPVIHDAGPAELLIHVEIKEIRRRARGVDGMEVHAEFTLGGRLFAQSVGWLRCVAPGVYPRVRWGGARMRSVGPPPHVTGEQPGMVGRELARDVVVGRPDRDGVRRLRVPLGHPVLFDHPLDHVPGMLAFEAMRQAAVARLGNDAVLPVSGDAEFPRFLEIDEECLIDARTVAAAEPGLAPSRVELTLAQGGVTAIRGWLELAPRAVVRERGSLETV